MTGKRRVLQFLTAHPDQREFTARGVALWLVARLSPDLQGKQRLTLVDSYTPIVSGWLQEYWRAQPEDSPPYLIDCTGHGPGAIWVRREATPGAVRDAAMNRIHKTLQIAMVNGLERSVKPIVRKLGGLEAAERVDVTIHNLADLGTEEIARMLNELHPPGVDGDGVTPPTP